MSGAKKSEGVQDAGVFDACKLQFEAGLAVMHALVAGAERMREMQLAAAHETEAQQREITDRIAKVRTMQDLAELQTKLASTYAQGAMTYWSKVAALAQQTQAELGALAQESCKGALGAVPGTMPPAADLSKAVEAALESARRANEALLQTWKTAAAPTESPRAAGTGKKQ